MRGFAHRQRMQQMGLRREDVMTRPCIAIINTWSELSPCHAHLRERAESVKRGVLMAGGTPFELPALSLGEVMVKPTTMLYRNLLAMEVEELLRSHPVDGVVLLAGCDKTTPAHGDGRHQRRPAGDLLRRRADAQRPPSAAHPHGLRGAHGGRRHAHQGLLGRATRPARSTRPNGCSWNRA